MHLPKFLLAISVLFLFSCKKETPEDENLVSTFEGGIMVLNEGLFQQNNSSLSWINLSSGSVNNELFAQKAGRDLGDTGNDLKRYGNKIYIVVNVSSTVEIIDAKNGNPISQIQMVEGGIPKQPRYITFYGNKAYVSCYDGYVDVIDTASLVIENRIQVGSNPEDMVISNGKLFVANSGGLNYPNVDSTVSVIDLTSQTELSKIIVGKNPGPMEVDQNGNVYTIARGNYSSIPSKLVQIDPISNNVIQTYSFKCSSIEKMNDKLLIMTDNAGTPSIDVFNPLTATFTATNLIDLTGITTPYKLHFDENLQQIYLTDAINYTNTGNLLIYSATGSLIKYFNVGLNPSSIVIYE